MYTALQTNILVEPASVKITSFEGSNIVSFGNESYSIISSLVNLLTKTGIPFQTIQNTSPGGNSEVSISIYVSNL